MKKQMIAVCVLALAGLLVYQRAFLIFFTQDDFIMIPEYSTSSLLDNIAHLFSYPSVSHFRPMQDLYYLIGGMIFAKNYPLYHLLNFILLLGGVFFILLTVKTLTGNNKVGFVAGFLYVVSAIHFNAMYWISGNVTLIGFLFFMISFYLLLKNKKILSVSFLFLGFLASEAVVFAIAILIASVYLFKIKKAKLFCVAVSALAGLWLTVRFFFLTPAQTLDAYQVSITPKILPTIKFYGARLLGLSESSGDLFLSGLILLFDFMFLGLIIMDVSRGEKRNLYLLCASIVIVGLFPFILIPNHLAGNYLSLSLFGVCLAIALALRRIPTVFLVIVLVCWLSLQVWVVRVSESNTWITRRAALASDYLIKIEKANVAPGTTIIFEQSPTSDSREAYIVLGGGRAINFWFPGKKYDTCFEFFENCESLEGKSYLIRSALY